MSLHNTVNYTLTLPDEAATQALGVALAACIKPGFVLHLQGDLGAGKTTLTRALLRALGVTGTLRSPTFALLEPYELPQLGGGTLHHFDFYRMEDDPHAWRSAGFEAAFDAPHAAIVEWPQYAYGLPVPNVRIVLEHTTLEHTMSEHKGLDAVAARLASIRCVLSDTPLSDTALSNKALVNNQLIQRLSYLGAQHEAA